MLIEGAKKEGQVVLYSALIVNQMLRPLAAGFMKKYPFIKMTYYRADSDELLPKISAEMRANNLVADVFEGSGGGEIAVEAGFTQPFHSPMLERLPESLSRSEGPSGADAALLFQHRLQHPAGAGRQGAEDLRGSARSAVEGQDGLAQRQHRPLSVHDQPAARLGRGASATTISESSPSRRSSTSPPAARVRWSIASSPANIRSRINIYAHHPLISAGKGAPVNSQLMDPVPSASGSLTVLKGAKHPHAAMLLTDFILSREGQQIMAQAEYFPAHPGVEPAPQLASIVPKKTGHAENFVSPQQLKE